MSKTPARTSSAKPAAKSPPVSAAGKKASPAAKAPAKAADSKAAPAKAPKTSVAAARKSPVDSSTKPVSTSKAPTPKPAAKAAPAKAPAKAAAAPAAKPAAAKGVAAAPAPAVAAPAPQSVVSRPSPAKASFASSLADRASPSATMNKSSVTGVLDQPRTAAPSDPKLANAWKNKAGRDLTDAEVLAMPDSEYMSDKQLEFFRTKLETLKEDLLSNAGETTEHLREDTTIVPDPADRATIEEEHALELRTRDRERKLLKKISQALARIDAGDYGFCDETGEPIGLGRLIARPTATLSLEAQQRRELKQKMFGD